MAKVVVSSLASDDFETIVRDLSLQAGARVATRYSADLQALFRRFAQFPDSGAARLALGPKVRIGVVAPFVVVYEYDEADDAVLVLRIVHGKRRMTRKQVR